MKRRSKNSSRHYDYNVAIIAPQRMGFSTLESNILMGGEDWLYTCFLNLQSMQLTRFLLNQTNIGHIIALRTLVKSIARRMNSPDVADFQDFVVSLHQHNANFQALIHLDAIFFTMDLRTWTLSYRIKAEEWSSPLEFPRNLHSRHFLDAVSIQ